MRKKQSGAKDLPPLTAEGVCLCGQIRFRFLDRLPPVGFCHCSQCRRASATGSNAVLNVRLDRFEWAGGEEHLPPLRDRHRLEPYLLRPLGPSQAAADAGRRADVRAAGALDGNPALRIAGHIFVGSKPDWVMIADGSPQFEVHVDGSG